MESLDSMRDLTKRSQTIEEIQGLCFYDAIIHEHVAEKNGF
jgi:hypothetical protein